MCGVMHREVTAAESLTRGQKGAQRTRAETTSRPRALLQLGCPPRPTEIEGDIHALPNLRDIEKARRDVGRRVCRHVVGQRPRDS